MRLSRQVGGWWNWLEIILIKHGKCDALHILEDLHILSLNDWLANNQTNKREDLHFAYYLSATGCLTNCAKTWLFRFSCFFPSLNWLSFSPLYSNFQLNWAGYLSNRRSRTFEYLNAASLKEASIAGCLLHIAYNTNQCLYFDQLNSNFVNNVHNFSLEKSKITQFRDYWFPEGWGEESACSK